MDAERAGRIDWRARARIRGQRLPEVWGAWLGVLAWEFFLTLTFDPRRVPEVDWQLASKEAFWLCTQLGRLLRRPVGWIYVVERGAGGRHHIHVLLIGTGGVLGSAPSAMWVQRNGNIHVQPVHDSARLVMYTTKEAALTGEVALSDTMKRYVGATGAYAMVALHKSSPEVQAG